MLKSISNFFRFFNWHDRKIKIKNWNWLHFWGFYGCFLYKDYVFRGFFPCPIHVHFTQYQTAPRLDEVDCKDSRNVGIPRMNLDTEKIRETYNLQIEIDFYHYYYIDKFSRLKFDIKFFIEINNVIYSKLDLVWRYISYDYLVKPFIKISLKIS